MIKAVLFDYGGVLSPGGKNFRQVLRNLLKVDALRDNTEQLVQDLGRGVISSQDFINRLNKDYQTNIDVEEIAGTHNFPRNEAVYSLAANLKKQGIKVGILSNTSDLNAKRLGDEGFYDGFDPIILSFNENLAKPDIELYHRAITRVDAKANEVLFIDDQERFLVPARNLGMHVIQADSQEQIVRDTKALLKKENGLGI
jgi:epoxide hydrolase-like predicted phosphatase